MKKTLSKTEAKKEIEEFFLNIEDKSPKEIQSVKRLAMRYNIPLKEKRKLFCKKCFNPYQKPSIRIKNDIIRMICDNCDNVSRWKI